jgi:hypothetical protein
MKRALSTAVLSFVCVGTLAQANLRIPNADLPGSPTFEVEASKQTFLPFEPIPITFRLVNRTSERVEIRPPRFLQESRLRILDPRLKTEEVTSLSLSTGGGPDRPGSTMVLNPGEKYEHDLIPMLNPNYLSIPGVYQLRFTMGDFESNSIDIVIDEPRGTDREAFVYLEKHGKDVRFGDGLFDQSGARALKDFVDRFPESPYAQFAVQSLARYYMHKGDLERAQAEFQKIKNSPIKALRDQTRLDLVEIDKKTHESSKP